MFGNIVAALFSLIVLLAHGIAAGAQVKITAGYGGELGYQAPIWVAHELKLFAEYGMISELVRIAGGARSTAARVCKTTEEI